MKIREATESDFKKMMNIAKELHPKWFDNFAINETLPLDLRIHKGFVAEEKGKIFGFVTYTSKEGFAELSWIGVVSKFHNKGIGAKLVKALEKKLKRIGVKELRVETVAKSTKYAPYKATRLFYKKLGFKVKGVRKVKNKDTGEKFDMATLNKKI